MLLGIHQCRGSREVVWIPTDPWPKLGRLKRRKHLPEDDTSTDVWYLDRYDFYLDLPDGLQPKYPDFYRYYGRTHRNPLEASTLASNPAEHMANKSPSSDFDDAVDGDRYKADPPENAKERPYWWPSPPERMERKIRDNMGNKCRLRRRTAIPMWNFYLPSGEDVEKYFLQNILLSQPFTKVNHEQRFFSKDNVSKTYMEECILRGLFRGYEEEAGETLNNAQARGYSVGRLRFPAEVLRAEDRIDATFFNNCMSDLDELDKHRAGDDEPMVADQAEKDPQLAEELKVFMNADDPGAAETLVNALNHWQRMVFEIFVAHFQQQQPKDVPDISTHCRASVAGGTPQLCAILTGVVGTGKSHVVRLLIAKVHTCGFSILVCGASGVAALNVGGRTIHSFFSLSLDLDWQSKEGTILWWMIRNAEMITVDELSLLSNELLHTLDDILHKVRRHKRNPFGGITVLLVGDPLHLRAVDLDIFDSAPFRNHFVPFVLTEVMRQGDGQFLDLLNCVRIVEETEDDHLNLQQRIAPNKDVSPQDLEDAPILVGRRNAMHRWNEHFMAQLGSNIVTLNATYVDMGGAPTNQAMCDYINSRNRRVLPQQVFVAAGMRARRIRNFSIRNHLVNSTMVVIKRWSNDVIVVCPIGRTREYPICRFQQIIPVSGPSVQVKILQFPIPARYACNVHGSQGCSYRIVWIDMATFFAAAHADVAFSRARSSQDLYILNYGREAFLVDPYYVQLWSWFVATNVLAPKHVQHIPPYPRRTFTFTLVAGIVCVCRSWRTKSHFPQNLDARILKVNMLLILKYVSFPWWSYIDRQIQGDKLSLEIDDLNEDGTEQPRTRGRPHGTSQQPHVGVQLLDGNKQATPL